MKIPLFQRAGAFALVLLGVIASAPAAEPSALLHDLNTPVFDASGRMIRRLTAKSGNIASTSLQLLDGKIEFFPPALSELSTSTLEFDHARYTKSAERIDGDGALTLTSKDGTVRARGFEGALETGRFTLNSAVQFDSEEFQLNGDRGELRFDPRATATDRAIKSVTLTGNVVLVGAAARKQGFDRIETTLARYDAAQSKVYVKLPVTGWKNGQHALLQEGPEFLEIEISRKPAAP